MDENSPGIHRPEEAFKVKDGGVEKFNFDDAISTTSQSKETSFSGKTAGSGKIPATTVEPRPNSDSLGPSTGNIDEKPTLTCISHEEIGGFGDDTNTIMDTDQGDKEAVCYEDTSADPLQEQNRAACDDVMTSADPILEKMRKAVEDADTSEKINQEGIMGLYDNADTSADASQEDTGEIVDKADGPRTHSWRYENFRFLLYEVIDALADGALAEYRMQQLKNGFLALLASLEDKTAVSDICSDAGTM